MNTVFGLIFWIRIFLSPFVTSLVVAALIVLSTPTAWSYLAAATVLLAGTITGTIFAERMRAKHGTIAFMGQLYQTNDVNRRTN
jgi:hypothetical protein